MTTVTEATETVVPRRRLLGGIPPLVLVALSLFGLMLICAVAANWIAPHSPFDQSLSNRLKPPAWIEGGTWSYPLGTDALGRDVLSRIIHGARASLLAGVLALMAGGGVGSALGIWAAYKGGRTDSIIMRVADANLAMPMIFFAMLLAVTWGPSMLNVVIAIGLVLWARFARLVRADALRVVQRDFIAMARINGSSTFRILWRHILPNVFNTILVLMTFQIGYVIVVEATLSFLGAGIPPPAPAWGQMVADGRRYVTAAWWISVFPGGAIFLTVIALNWIGDWLRDRFDPKLRQL